MAEQPDDAELARLARERLKALRRQRAQGGPGCLLSAGRGGSAAECCMC